MKREVIKIDEDKCNGCGLCIPNCHEGALQIIDGKARLISDLMCDGLGACIGHCPEGAMEIEVREAEPYDEVMVMKEMVKKGRNTVTAHLKHLKDHGEFVFLKQAVGFLMDNSESVDFPVREVIHEVHHTANHQNGGGCPGSRSMSFAAAKDVQGANATMPGDQSVAAKGGGEASQLTQWPVQMHLINPQAKHFRGSDLLLAADCVAYSMGNFHNDHLKGKTLAIACPKLDSNKEVYLEKLVRLINDAEINTLTVMKMEVPCCSGIEQMAQAAVKSADRKVPVKSITVGVKGNILGQEWL